MNSLQTFGTWPIAPTLLLETLERLLVDAPELLHLCTLHSWHQIEIYAYISHSKDNYHRIARIFH